MPHWHTTYTDDLMFCVWDGTPLIGQLDDVGQQAVIKSMPVLQ